MEADLQRFYGIDYRDRWRTDENGCRLLTLRRLYVLLRNLPPDSALGSAERDGEPVWTVEAHLLDDLRMAMTSTKKHPAKPHPQRPVGAPKSRMSEPERRRRVGAYRRRMAERAERLAAREQHVD